jgi:cytochrome c5
MNTQSLLILSGLLVACGGEEPPAPVPAPAPKVEAPSLKPWREALTDADILGYGERIFMAKGSNTCNDCHGKDGTTGRLEQSANLTQPATWRSTRALGGDQAKVDAALTYLVSNGGKKFNQNYVAEHPDAGWDWSKADAKAYDIQMFGVTQSSTMAEIKKIRKDMKKAGVALDKADMTAFGAQAVLGYVRNLSANPAAE